MERNDVSIHRRDKSETILTNLLKKDGLRLSEEARIILLDFLLAVDYLFCDVARAGNPA